MKHAIQKGNALSQPQGIIQHEATSSIRLNKFISESGYASRRGADRLVENGLVTINNVVAEVGTQVFPGDTVSVEGNIIGKVQNLVYIALNKPVGITSTTDPKDSSNIVKFMNYEDTIFPIGRLDKDSFGLILMTNDGNIVNKILREEYGHDKEYIVSVDKPFNHEFASAMSNGVNIYNQAAHMMQVTEPCEVESLGPKTFRIILRQGLNRQIRRMTKALGFKVVSLQRVRIMNITIDNLKPGEWRYLTAAELQEINHRIAQ
ncbi:pseudouridine synthase [Erysipelothrix sp. HDW6C]|uniref:pseudouridine synthase n=1 Tax=Erysipelothrix sp. HDW6C TaxID=2714930 RepID=UPI00196B78C0|nr:pseudouridine synthase [Erysipelothrix sp. HDW6C]